MTDDPDDDFINFDVPDDEPPRSEAEAMSVDDIDKEFNEYIAASGARIQDGTIKNEDDFWQLIQDVAYMMEGENRTYERERLLWLKECLDKWFASHPELGIEQYFKRDPESGEMPTERVPLNVFAMHCVHRLVGAFSFNDRIGADAPDFRQRTFDRITEPLGPAVESAQLIEHRIAEDVLDAITHGRALDQQLIGLITSPDRMASVGLALIRAILNDNAS
jgi:hypothetical protein